MFNSIVQISLNSIYLNVTNYAKIKHKRAKSPALDSVFLNVQKWQTTTANRKNAKKFFLYLKLLTNNHIKCVIHKTKPQKNNYIKCELFLLLNF